MILIYTDHGEVPKEILSDMKKHNLIVKNQLIFVVIPLNPEKQQQDIEDFTKMFIEDYKIKEHTNPMGKIYFTLTQV